eukprot:359461-Chlamydomonas_euryale.AAC.4
MSCDMCWSYAVHFTEHILAQLQRQHWRGCSNGVLVSSPVMHTSAHSCTGPRGAVHNSTQMNRAAWTNYSSTEMDGAALSSAQLHGAWQDSTHMHGAAQSGAWLHGAVWAVHNSTRMHGAEQSCTQERRDICNIVQVPHLVALAALLWRWLMS